MQQGRSRSIQLFPQGWDIVPGATVGKYELRVEERDQQYRGGFFLVGGEDIFECEDPKGESE